MQKVPSSKCERSLLTGFTRITNNDGGKQTQKAFKFDKIMDQRYSQEQVYEMLQIKNLISKVIAGYHATVFAYG